MLYTRKLIPVCTNYNKHSKNYYKSTNNTKQYVSEKSKKYENISTNTKYLKSCE